jgi:hypothetical protein
MAVSSLAGDCFDVSDGFVCLGSVRIHLDYGMVNAWLLN